MDHSHLDRRELSNRAARGRVQHVEEHLRSEREFFIDNLLVQIHFIIAMIRWTGLAPWELEFPFPGSLTSTFLRPAYDQPSERDQIVSLEPPEMYHRSPDSGELQCSKPRKLKKAT